MKLKSFLDYPYGMRFMLDNLNTASSVSKRILADSGYISDPDILADEFGKLGSMREFYRRDDRNRRRISDIRYKISGLKDISHFSGIFQDKFIPGDIELFEIKSFALIANALASFTAELPANIPEIDSLDEVVNILDPDGFRNSTFYIYDSYSSELASKRILLKKNPEDELLDESCREIEDKVRADIKRRLSPFSEEISNQFKRITDLDIIIAKVLQMEEMELSLPVISEKGFKFNGIFNPEVKYFLHEQGKDFQSNDIENGSGVLLITGANMGGKTVLLKSLTLSYILFHFAFGIPASEASVTPVKAVSFITGDSQDIKSGYSSFASEILKINKIITQLKRGDTVASFIDEPARSTNPSEGTALAESLLEILSDFASVSVVTTHYNISGVKCKRLRIKGIVNNIMNYSLIDDSEGVVPKEAINIARSLGADEEWMNKADNYFKENI